MTTLHLEPGAILAGKYQIQRVLGEGGMGIVLAAQHLALQQTVAIKVLRGAVAENAEVVARFLREARVAAQITSPHVARVTDADRLPDGSPYIVMEYLEGHDLAVELRTRGRLGVDESCAFLRQAADAVSEAHGLGIVHRDLKPANIFLARRRDGAVIAKVVDFGIAKVVHEQALTNTSGILGSPLYMSPEQLRSSKTIDHRTDVWALGATLFQLLAGVPPFEAEDLPQLLVKIMEEPARDVRTLRPDVPAHVAAVIACSLEKDPSRRFASVRAMVEALGQGGALAWQQTEVVQAGPSGTLAYVSTAAGPGAAPRPSVPLGTTTGGVVAASVPAARDVATANDAQPVPAQRQPRRGPIVAGLVAVVALGVAAVAVALGGGAENAPSSEPASTPAAASLPAAQVAPSLGVATAEGPDASASTAASAAPKASAIHPPVAVTSSVSGPGVSVGLMKKKPALPPTATAQTTAAPAAPTSEGFKKGDY